VFCFFVDLDGGGFDSPTTGTSGEEAEAAAAAAARARARDVFHTPTRGSLDSSLRSARTTGYSKTRVNAMGYVKLQHFSESKRTSGFWKERLGKRDLTSILSSPLSQKLF
jgi:hypothetical protein